jgi:hypothetical protein
LVGRAINEVAAEAEENLQMTRGYCDVAGLIVGGRGVSKLSMQQPHSSNESMQKKRSDQPEGLFTTGSNTRDA